MEAVITQGAAMMSSMNGMDKGMQEKCKGAADLSKMMGLFQGSHAVACKAAQESCVSSCKAALSAPGPFLDKQQKFKENLKKCEGFEKNFANQVMQALNFANTFAGSAACEQAAKNAESKLMAQNASTQVNCNNAEVKRTHPVCICKDNPRDPSCIGGARVPGVGGSLLGGGRGSGVGRGDAGDGGSDFASLGGPGGGGLDGDGLYGAGAGIGGDGSGKGSGVNPIPNGGGGGPSSPFGAGGGAGGGDGGGYNTSSPSTGAVISGVSGSSGGGGYGGRSGGGLGGAGSSSSSGFLQKLKDKFNIKDALPDKSKLMRGLAGMSQQAAGDGVTGATGESIWQKASRQYKNQERQGEFLPPGQR
jgi:hypothetical protein